MEKFLKKQFDGTRNFRLGTAKNPANVHVQTEKKRKEIEAVCKQNQWICTITVDPEQPEDITQYEQLLKKPETFVLAQKVGPNDPCVCGSGKKYKKCCWKP